MYEYTLKRSRRKTLRLEITRELDILIRAPLHCPQREIDRFAARHADWVAKHLEQMKRRLAEHPPLVLSQAEEEALRQTAQRILPEKVAYYGSIMGLCPTGVKITGARTRYGSCSAKNRICFSWRLMLCPPEAVDLVVVHELAHIQHKNHGPAFYALLASVFPDHKERKKLLRPT